MERRYRLRGHAARPAGVGDATASEPVVNILVRLDPYALRDTDDSLVVALDDVTFTAQVAL